MYDIRAVHRVWEKNKAHIKRRIVVSLMYKYSVYEFSTQELMHEAQLLFFLNFYDYYESSDQFNAFLYTCVRNFLINYRKRKWTRGKYITTNANSIIHGLGLRLAREDNKDMYHTLWNNVPDNSNEKEKVNVKRIVTEVKKKLTTVGQQVMEYMLEEHNVADICTILGLSVNSFYNEREEVRRVTREVMLSYS